MSSSKRLRPSPGGGDIAAFAVAACGLILAAYFRRAVKGAPSGVEDDKKGRERVAAPLSSPAVLHALRLAPGELLLESLDTFCAARGLLAASIVTCVGSLTTARLRFANQTGPSVVEGPLEIVSLVGTLSSAPPASAHIHLSVADGAGRVTGGHALSGCVVFTTAEIVLAEASSFVFARQHCDLSTYDELAVVEREKEKRDRRGDRKR